MRRILHYIFLWGIVLLVVPGILQAQDAFSARFETEALEPLLGEPFELLLVVTVPEDYEVVFPTFGQEWGEAFTVLDVGEPLVDGTVHRLPLTVAAWQLATLQTPPLTVLVRDVNGAEDRLPVEPISLYVPTTLDQQLELRTSRRVWFLPYPLAVLAGVGVVIATGLGFGAYTVYNRYASARRGTAIRQAPRTLAQRTVSDLNRIRAEAPDIITQYEAMGDRLRLYVEEMFGFTTGDETTSELMDDLNQRGVLSEGRQRELQFLLEQADLAKFAPAEVYTPDKLSLIQLAVQWVQTVEREVSQ